MLLETAAITTLKRQQYLRLLNLRLHVVVRDVTGMSIIEAICSGETNPQKLACLRHGNYRKSEAEIAKALQSNGRKDYLFALQQELALYKVIQEKIQLYDREIEKLLKEQI